MEKAEQTEQNLHDDKLVLQNGEMAKQKIESVKQTVEQLGDKSAQQKAYQKIQLLLKEDEFAKRISYAYSNWPQFSRLDKVDWFLGMTTRAIEINKLQGANSNIASVSFFENSNQDGLSGSFVKNDKLMSEIIFNLKTVITSNPVALAHLVFHEIDHADFRNQEFLKAKQNLQNSKDEEQENNNTSTKNAGKESNSEQSSGGINQYFNPKYKKLVDIQNYLNSKNSKVANKVGAKIGEFVDELKKPTFYLWASNPNETRADAYASKTVCEILDRCKFVKMDDNKLTKDVVDNFKLKFEDIDRIHKNANLEHFSQSLNSFLSDNKKVSNEGNGLKIGKNFKLISLSSVFSAYNNSPLTEEFARVFVASQKVGKTFDTPKGYANEVTKDDEIFLKMVLDYQTKVDEEKMAMRHQNNEAEAEEKIDAEINNKVDAEENNINKNKTEQLLNDGAQKYEELTQDESVNQKEIEINNEQSLTEQNLTEEDAVNSTLTEQTIKPSLTEQEIKPSLSE